MAKKTSSPKVVIPVKIQPIWQIGIIFPDNKKLTKLKCTLNDLMDTYFMNLDKYLDKGFDAEQLLELYKKTYSNKGIKVIINYIDSYAHKWTGKVAWPKQERFIEYLNKRINDKSK